MIVAEGSMIPTIVSGGAISRKNDTVEVWHRFLFRVVNPHRKLTSYQRAFINFGKGTCNGDTILVGMTLESTVMRIIYPQV